VFDESAPKFGPSYADAYDKSLTWEDRAIGSFVQGLDDRDVLKRTLIVVSSDHGEAFLEHGWEGHARDLYGETMHVPFLIIPPFILEEGIRVSEMVGNVDVWPTILDLVGLPAMEGTDGQSMVPQIVRADGTAPPTDDGAFDRPVVMHMDQRWGNGKSDPEELVSIIDGPMKIIVHRYNRSKDELYNLVDDPGEQSNLIAGKPPELALMLQKVDEYLENSTSPWGSGPGSIELDQMRLNQLKALGYRIGD
jgi:arylsulfatase A-like enzyme